VQGDFTKTKKTMSNTISFLNTIAATAGDITLVGRKLNVAITSVTGTPAFPTMDYPNIVTATVNSSVSETLHVTRVGWTAASSTVFGFTVTQIVNGQYLTKAAYYTSDASGTDTEIGTALAAEFANTALGVAVTYVAANGYVTVTALTGTPTYQISLGATGTMTNTSQMAGVAIASSTVATPSVITSNAHGLVNGSVITIVSADTAKLASGTFVVQYLSANTYSLYTLSGNPVPGVTGTTTATVVKVATSTIGSGTDLAAAGVTGASAGVGYTRYTFSYNIPLVGVPGSQSLNTGFTHTLYVKQWATSTTTSYTTNFAAFAAKMNQVLSNMGASGTIAVPVVLVDTLAVAQVVPAA
jgi:hypothetical protein